MIDDVGLDPLLPVSVNEEEVANWLLGWAGQDRLLRMVLVWYTSLAEVHCTPKVDV